MHNRDAAPGDVATFPTRHRSSLGDAAVTIAQQIDEFTVDVAELRGASNRLAELGDGLDDVRRRILMSRASAWGSVEALESGYRFRDRFHHLLAGLASEVEDARVNLRQTASAYEMADENAHTALRHLGAAL